MRTHRFDGKTCVCGVRHRVPRERRKAVRLEVRKIRNRKIKAWLGPVKATPALVKHLKAAIGYARAAGDKWVRCAHVMLALGVRG